MTDKLRELFEDVQTVYEGKGMVVHPNSFDRLRTEIIKLDNINKQQNIKDCENFNKKMKEIKEQWNKEHYQLTKAKEVIKGLLCILYDRTEEELNSGDKDIIHKAEEFLKKE